ncbi:MAG: DNA replication/repair protein RecF [Chlorobiaceae bacterium]|nr:DNA replication/repair protein RecF [Chlorobiaceae bacterium]
MRLETIRIANFRNHRVLEVEPGPSITNIYGRNGSGKTSILEAIHFCALTKGFAGSADRDCLSFGEEIFSIRAAFVSDHGRRTEIRISYSPANEKQIFVNEQELQTFSRHIGLIPCVTFSPHELSIVNGPPSERRRFLDTAICQYDRTYMADLLQYRRVLQQRNALLANFTDHPSSHTGLDIWTEQLAAHAASIVLARLLFIVRFREMFDKVYCWLPGGAEPSINYCCSLRMSGKEMSKDDLKDYYIERYTEIRNQEILRRQTLAGPHRDDLMFFLDKHDIRKYASQGQQRGYLVAMKLTMHRYLHEMSGEQPISLLDDLFSELDDTVSRLMVDALSSCGQVLITSTKEREEKGVTSFSIEEAVNKASAQI